MKQPKVYAGDKKKVVPRVEPRTEGQLHYWKSILSHDVTVAVGPAGSGKTFLAVAAAVRDFKSHKVDKLIFCRPAVEAGEKIGFLPGDIFSKIDPYLRPIHDSLEIFFSADEINDMRSKRIIEAAPLGLMRGRSLNNAFIILDEAQNTTVLQMKMFVTRMGEGSKVVIVGDSTQVDLPRGVESGFTNLLGFVDEIPEIAVCHLTETDIVRHRVVQKIVEAYKKREAQL